MSSCPSSKTLFAITVIVSLCITFDVASASASKNAALGYEKCITDLKNVSSEQIAKIAKANPAIQDRANALADAAVKSCAQAKTRLTVAMTQENKTGKRYDDLVLDIERLSSDKIKVHLLNLAMKESQGKR